MSKLGRNLTVKLNKLELDTLNLLIINVVKSFAILHFVNNEKMTEEQAESRVKIKDHTVEISRFHGADGMPEWSITDVEIDVFVEEKYEIQQEPRNGTETV